MKKTNYIPRAHHCQPVCGSPHTDWTESGRTVTVRCKDGEVVVSRELLRLASPWKLEEVLKLKTALEVPDDTCCQWQLLANQLGPWTKPDLSMQDCLELLLLARTHNFPYIEDQMLLSLCSKLRERARLKPGNVGYIAEWLPVAERYNLWELKINVLTAWSKAPSKAVRRALKGDLGKELEKLPSSISIQAMLAREEGHCPRAREEDETLEILCENAYGGNVGDEAVIDYFAALDEFGDDIDDPLLPESCRLEL